MAKSDVVWGCVVGAGAAYETYTLRRELDDSTLSETTRRVFRTRTRAGKIVFVTSWAGFSVWWVHHILT